MIAVVRNSDYAECTLEYTLLDCFITTTAHWKRLNQVLFTLSPGDSRAAPGGRGGTLTVGGI